MSKIIGPIKVFCVRFVVASLPVFLCICLSCERDTDSSSTATDHNAIDQQQSMSVDAETANWSRPRSDERLTERDRMVDVIEHGHGLKNTVVFDAMRNVPRHWFVPVSEQNYAYIDSPLPIGYDQTISQPFIVAYMTAMLELDSDKKVLEIGTGSGYQAAVLNEFTPHVYSIEIVEPLAERAAALFKEHGYDRIKAKHGDGYKGWAEHAPFDAVIVTCAPDDIPEALVEQLKPNGRMAIPVGKAGSVQELVLVTKSESGKITVNPSMPVRFVPMIHETKR